MAQRLRVSNTTRGTIVAARVRVADSMWSRFAGLMGRRGLAEDEGLWIVPCSSVHMFFVLFALDIIYADAQNRVVKTVIGLRPWRISAARRAHATLELPAGTIARSRTAPGDSLSFDAAD